jgi:hypothetical protein
MLGNTPMPWQEYAADLIGEIGDDGLFRWPMVIISVPRQAGKTTISQSSCVHRLFTGRGRRVWSTAQTGQKARSKWLEQVEVIESDIFPLRELFTTKKAAGNEQLILSRLNSKFAPHPPTEDSLHGEQSDLNFIDEAWVFDDAEAAALMQAIVPTQTTRPGAQTIIVSTMGTAASTWFHGLVDKAKQPGSNIALLDYGIGPDDDPTDLDVIADNHPAYGYTVTMDSLKRARDQLAPAEFARAYGNRQTGARKRLIPLSAWQSTQTEKKIPSTSPIVFAAAIDIDRTETVIVAAGVLDDMPIIEVVDRRPGTNWAAPRLDELVKKFDASAPWIDPIGPSSTLVDQLEALGHDMPKINTRIITSAAADLMDRITATDADGLASPRVLIRPDDSLDIAAEIVEQRRVGEAWAWSRKTAGGSIASLEAATLAIWGLEHKPLPPIAPMIR